MPEYRDVEKPFLDQLAALGWGVIDQGIGMPEHPGASERSSFREVLLEDRFKRSVGEINRTEDGPAWLTKAQLDEVFEDLLRAGSGSSGLLEANEATLKLLFNNARVDENEVTGEQSPVVKLIDFDRPECNDFLAINQFRIDTPGGVKSRIIPDIVLFVNGLPLVVVECKDGEQVAADPMHEAFRQLMRYSDQRGAEAEGLREGEPRLFHTNQVLVRTCGETADYGTITATDPRYFFPWRDVVHEEHRDYSPPLSEERAQEVLIKGMLAPTTLLDLVRTCTVFMDSGPGRIKVMGRYQQYRAMHRIIDRLRHGGSAQERSGVVWHTQGSGKSLTMVFAVRKLRMCDDLKDHKIIMVNDRTDLEEQLEGTATLTGETVNRIESTDELRNRLSTDSSNLNMVMVHKFHEQASREPEYWREARRVAEPPPEYHTFGTVNASDRVLMLIDEAHRTQYSELGDNLFEAFPNATKVAFSGTPLIVRRGNRQLTHERFGGYIDKYKLHDSVEDGATVQILYEGRTAETAINERHEFDTKFEDLFRDRSEEELRAIRKKYGTEGDILDAPARIEAVARDLVEHYVEHILPNGFKAQVVANSKQAAVRYEKAIRTALDERIQQETRKHQPDSDLLRKLRFLQIATVISAGGTNDPAEQVEARRRSQEMNAVENFKKAFDGDEPNTGIAFLVVCDMLLTGFDAPIEQVMYIDKKVRDHNLLQTIARVNRVAKNKWRGYIVDYVGLANHLKEALSVYDSEGQEDIEQSLKDVSTELPILESRYRRLIQLFEEAGISGIEGFARQTLADAAEADAVCEQAVRLVEDIEKRAEFEVYLKQFMQSMDAILPDPRANEYKIPAKRFGYLMARVRQRYKDESLDLAGAGEKIKTLIDEHLISLGIDPKIPPRELFSEEFYAELDKQKDPRAKASEMEHAIRKHLKVRYEEDPALYERLSDKLEALIERHKEEWDQLYRELCGLREEVEAGRGENEVPGLSPEAVPFYDLIGKLAFGDAGVPDENAEAVKQLVREIIDELGRTIGRVNFWQREPEVNQLKGDLSRKLIASGVDPLVRNRDKIVTEVTALARKRERDLLR